MRIITQVQIHSNSTDRLEEQIYFKHADKFSKSDFVQSKRKR